MDNHGIKYFENILVRNITKEKYSNNIKNALTIAFTKHEGQFKVLKEDSIRIPYITTL